MVRWCISELGAGDAPANLDFPSQGRCGEDAIGVPVRRLRRNLLQVAREGLPQGSARHRVQRGRGTTLEVFAVRAYASGVSTRDQRFAAFRSAEGIVHTAVRVGAQLWWCGGCVGRPGGSTGQEYSVSRCASSRVAGTVATMRVAAAVWRPDTGGGQRSDPGAAARARMWWWGWRWMQSMVW